MRLKISIFLYLLFATAAIAECDFLDADYTIDLRNPQNIEKIAIEVPKSAKFTRNFVRIITSRTKNIPASLKKNFRANVSVQYPFGKCTFDADVRQHGDLKDHVDFGPLGPVRSLKISLKDGNILGAVKFKLLIPETRNGVHEVLGALLMRKVGVISPETFLTEVILNDVPAIMLFQEDSRKELLERNSRREGPVLEGDEEPLWDTQFRSDLWPIALSRVENKNWLKKGQSSLDIG
jgi:hypothetical protein